MAADPTLPRPGEIVASKYRIERLLGAGGMGSVFEAVHGVTGKHFAIKWLLPGLSGSQDAVKRFIREAQVAGRFEHPNVVEVYDIGEERGSFYMVMELLRGEPLSAYLARVRRVSPQEACEILLPCMRGVARAHAAGIVHRDLKPANIFLCRSANEPDDRPKVLDFGISKVMSGGEVDLSITKGGMVMGTPHYMSPEQVRGKGVDHRADIYAFGVIMYELLAGKLPFPGETYAELVLQIATDTAKPLTELVPGLPQGLADVVRRAMARNPADRFEDLERMGRALEPYAAGTTFNSRRAPASQPGLALDRNTTPLTSETEYTPAFEGLGLPAPPARRVLFWSVAGLLLAVAIVFTIGLRLQSRPAADGQRTSTTAAGASPGESVPPQPGAPSHANDVGAQGLQRGSAQGEVPPDELSPEQILGPNQRQAVEEPWQPPAHPRVPPGTSPVDPGNSYSRSGRDEARRLRSTPAKSTFGEPSGADSTTPGKARPKKGTGRLGVQMDENEF